MSHFDSYTTAGYVEGLRSFLAIPKKDFAQTQRPPGCPKKRGKLPPYPADALAKLEFAVNAKAARAEAADSTIAERLRIARDYLGLTDDALAREIGISGELVRRWGVGLSRILNIPAAAHALNVPAAWLEYGGAENLPANSHLGVRVGDDSTNYRELLYHMTTAILVNIVGHASEMETQAFIEARVMADPAMGQTARRAGGRWQFLSGVLLFSPWIPIAAHGLTRRYWTDEVEAITEDEQANNVRICAAWRAVKSRCASSGLDCLTRPGLQSRVATNMVRAERFGVDLNEAVAYAMAHHLP